MVDHPSSNVHSITDKTAQTAAAAVSAQTPSQDLTPAQPTQFELELTTPTRKLDPAWIQLSRWANRHETSFKSSAFANFKAEIAATGGNIQPIKVRPLPALGQASGGLDVANISSVTDTASQPFEFELIKFELIYGHRRHRACLELGLPVFALVEEATDVELFEQMERENRGRKNLSPWEQATMYRTAERTKLYPSLRQMANKLGVSVSVISKSLKLSKLPVSVVEAFPSPTAIQFRWGQALSDIAKKDPKGLREKALALTKQNKNLSATAVFSALMSEPTSETTPDTPTQKNSPSAFTITRSNQSVVTLTTDPQGRSMLCFEPGVLLEQQQQALMQLMDDFLPKT
jgi:ParB family transcriptional regulator, chromosome partitioning protein